MCNTINAQIWEEIGFNFPSGDSVSYNTEITFTNKDTGWVFTYTGNTYKLFKTINGGQSWQNIRTINRRGSIYIAAFSMEPDFFYMITGDVSSPVMSDAIFTTNGGLTWDSTEISDGGFSSIHFFTQERGIAISGSYSWTTTDGGQTWNRKGEILLSRNSFFYNEKLGWSVGYSPFGTDAGCIAKTTDGGTSWEYQDSTTFGQVDYFGIDFIDSLKGFAIGGSINKTIDGGNNWLHNLYRGMGGYDIGFLDSKNGWLSGGGQILRTIDGGETWKLQFESTEYYFFKKIIILKKDEVAYVLGINPDNNSATLLRADLSKLTDVNENKEAIPNKFILCQNYPNPFNPSTVISYQLPVFSHVILKIYGILGREVVTLVNKYEAAGTYKVTFDAGNLSSGIYLYTLRAGGFVQTKKLILLK